MITVFCGGGVSKQGRASGRGQQAGCGCAARYVSAAQPSEASDTLLNRPDARLPCVPAAGNKSSRYSSKMLALFANEFPIFRFSRVGIIIFGQDIADPFSLWGQINSTFQTHHEPFPNDFHRFLIPDP
jgi:hypothetical protein